MEQVFASLSKRQTMLLLTSLAFGGNEAVEAYAHLPAEEEELLRYRAPMLLQIPRDKRIPFLVQEIKRLVTQRRKVLGTAEPDQIAGILRGERPALVEVVLRSLPADLADQTRALLPDHKPPDTDRDIRPDVQSIIRAKLEDALRAQTPPVGVFRFSDLLTLQQREVLAVADRMGARVLATAIAGLLEVDRDVLLGKLPPDQRALAARAAEAGKVKKLTEDDSRVVLEIHGALENPSMGMRSAGAQRIMRAAVAQGAEFAQRLLERHQAADLGKLMARWFKDEKNKPIKADGGRMDIVEQMERLAQKGVIDRPIRLPPPMKPPAPRAPPAGPQLTSNHPAFAVSKMRLPPVPGRVELEVEEGSEPDLPGGRVVAPAPRDRVPIARLADVQRSRSGDEPAEEESTSPNAQKLPAREGPPAKKRIIRDGKPLEEAGERPRRSITSSPVIQPVPKRKVAGQADPSTARSRTGSAARSPVIKGQGRGPKGGSR